MAPAFNWRLVLDNLHLGWPADVIAQAKALRDGELRATATPISRPQTVACPAWHH